MVALYQETPITLLDADITEAGARGTLLTKPLGPWKTWSN